MLRSMHDLVTARSQFVIATHSPILMAYPEATIYHLAHDGIHVVRYEDTAHYQVTRGFVTDYQSYLRHLFDENPSSFDPKDSSQ
jgi:predicted ATPase